MSDAVVGGGGLSPRSLLRRAASLSVASVLNSVIAVPVSILVARWLGPEDYGHVQIVLLFYFYGYLARLGLFEAGVRQLIHERGMGRDSESLRVQNVAVTADALTALVPALALAAIAPFRDSGIEHFGLAIAPLILAVSNTISYFTGLHIARQHFELVGRISAVRALLYGPVVLAGVHWFGAEGAIVAPSITDAVLIVIYSTRRPGLRLTASVDWHTSRQLLRVGLPMGLLAVVYWGYRMAGMTALAVEESAGAVGVFAFAATPVLVATRALASLQTVLAPTLWKEMADDRAAWMPDSVRFTIMLTALAGCITNVAQASFGPVVSVVAPRYEDSIALFHILAFNIVLLMIATVPSAVLQSVRFNRQSRELFVWFAAFVVNVVANLVVLRAALGSPGVAWNDIWIQVLVALTLFRMAGRLLGPAWSNRQLARSIVPLLVLTSAIGAALHATRFKASDYGEAAMLLGTRLLPVALCWGAVALGLRRLLTASLAPSSGMPAE